MSKIINVRDKEAIVDNEYFDKLNKFHWCLSKKSHTNYAVTSYKSRTISMHRFVMALKLGIPIEKLCSNPVDHIDHNGLNNQADNLRLVTQSENCQNRTMPKQSNNYIGVHKCKYGYNSKIGINGEVIYLGTFEKEIDAAIRRDIASLKIYNKTCVLNFPKHKIEYQQLLDEGFDPIPKHDILIPYSDYSGVTFRKDLDKWQAYISITQQKDNNLDGDHRIVVGTYNTEQEAIEAHKNAIDQLLLGNEIITPHQAKVKAPYNGVQLNKSGKYIARIVHNKERHSLDTYDTPEEAAEVYDCALIILHGDLSKLNFPTKIDEYKTKISDGYNPIQEKKAKTSKYKGISYRKDKKKWEAYIQDPETKKRKRLGYFTTENDAIEAVNESKQK